MIFVTMVSHAKELYTGTHIPLIRHARRPRNSFNPLRTMFRLISMRALSEMIYRKRFFYLITIELKAVEKENVSKEKSAILREKWTSFFCRVKFNLREGDTESTYARKGTSLWLGRREEGIGSVSSWRDEIEVSPIDTTDTRENSVLFISAPSMRTRWKL